MELMTPLAGAPLGALAGLLSAAILAGLCWVAVAGRAVEAGGTAGSCPVCGSDTIERGRPEPGSWIRWSRCWTCGRFSIGEPVGKIAYVNQMADVSYQRLELFERLERAGLDLSAEPWEPSHVPSTAGLKKLAEHLEDPDGPVQWE